MMFYVIFNNDQVLTFDKRVVLFRYTLGPDLYYHDSNLCPTCIRGFSQGILWAYSQI